MEENTENNSEATTETVAENTNANLSMEDLAASLNFAENVESEPEDTSTTEAVNDVTESVTVDAAEEQEGDVLLQSDEDSEEEAIDDAEEETSEQPKGLQKALKQINRLTARAKGAEEEVATLKAQVESLKSQPAKEAEPEGKPVLDKVQNVADLEKLRKEAISAKMWALQNLGKEYVEVNGVEYDDDQIRNILTEAEEFLTEKIPQRANFLQQKQSYIQDTINTFPWSAKGEGPEWELFKTIRDGDQYKEVLDGLPNGDYVAAMLVEGVQSVKARQAKAKKTPKGKAKTPPTTDPADAVAPPAEKKEVRQKKKREAILGKGNVSVNQFAQYLNT